MAMMESMQPMQQQRLVPKEHKNLAKGFVIGFIAAQFVSGWVSYPAILLILILYVFMGQAARYVIDTILARVPGVAMVIRFLTSYRAVTGSDNSTASPFDTTNNLFGPQIPQQSPFYQGQQGSFV